MMFNSVEIPSWMNKLGHRPAKRTMPMRKMLWGGDTETMEGPPISFQFYNPQRKQHIWIDDPETATDTLLTWMETLPTKMMHVVYIHVLDFDMVSFFWDARGELMTTTAGEFSFACKSPSGTDWSIDGAYGTPTYCIMVDEHRTRTVYFVDSKSYYQGTLADAANLFCPDLPKLEKPKGLGHKYFERDDQEFLDYAMRDAEIAYHIGTHLEKIHARFDVPQTISVAQMCSKVFKRHFIKEPIMLPEAPVIEASLLAYHGGKNNITLPAGFYRNVSSLDISSAYPDAMHSMPSFYHPNLYKGYSAKRARWVPETGIYYVSGFVKECRWPIFFDAAFKAVFGHIEKIAVTGYELNEALRSGEFEPSSIEGWYYDAEEDFSEPPMREYVSHFYGLKESERDAVLRLMYKLLLNSLSGKYIQTRQRNRMPVFDVAQYDLVQMGDITAGGLFHPFIAALITGHTRAKMHRMEHKFEAMHTATDGIFTQVLHAKLPNETGLGGMVTEAHGDLMLLRNKCYILYNDKPTKKGAIESRIFPGRWIIKYAKHGFQGDVFKMEYMAVTGARNYKLEKRNSLRWATQMGKIPNNFEERKFKLYVPPLTNVPKYGIMLPEHEIEDVWY